MAPCIESKYSVFLGDIVFSGGSFLDLNVGEMPNMSAIVPHARVIVIITTRPFQALDMEEMGRSIVLPLNINILGVEEV